MNILKGYRTYIIVAVTFGLSIAMAVKTKNLNYIFGVLASCGFGFMRAAVGNISADLLQAVSDFKTNADPDKVQADITKLATDAKDAINKAEEVKP